MAQPSIIEKINYLIDIFIDPCDAPITVYARWAWPAFMKALITFYALDLFEVVHQGFRTSVQPLRSRSQKKGSRRSKAGRGRIFKKAGAIVAFDYNEWVGKKLGKFFNMAPKAQGLTAGLWVAEGLIQRTTFFIFLASLTLDFFWEWLSMVEESPYCQAKGDTVLLATLEEGTYVAIAGWSAFNVPNVQKQRGSVTYTGFGGVFSGKSGHLIIGFKVRGESPQVPVTKVWMRIRYTTASGTYYAAEEVQEVSFQEDSDYSITATFSTTTNWVTEILVESGGVVVTDVYLSVGGKS